MDMIDDTRDIRITRLEGRVETLQDVQGAILDMMDVLIANQKRLEANQDEMKSDLVKVIDLLQALTLDVADLKDRVIGRPMGFALPEDDDS